MPDYPPQPYPNQPWPQQTWVPPPTPPRSPPQSQVQLPAIFMLVLATLGVFLGVSGLVQWWFMKDMMPQMMRDATTMQERINAQIEQDRKKRAAETGLEYQPGPPPPIQEMGDLVSNFFAKGGSVAIVTSILEIVGCGIVIAGSASMLSMRYYPLGFIAAVLTMIPGTSACCLLGLPLGIWTIVVLLRPEVRAAFR